MADYYADNTNGDDTTGDGSSGNPWATIQKAVDNATGGDTIHLANTSAFVLSSSVNWTLFGATSADAPLLITSWDNGGSITIDFPAIGGEAATSRVAAEIDGNDAVSSILSSSGAPLYVYLNGLQMHSTTGALVGRLNGWTLNECEFWDSSGAAMVSGSGAGNVISCIFRDSGGSSVNGLSQGPGTVIDSYIFNVTGNGLDLISSYANCINTVIDTYEESGIRIANKDYCLVDGNLIRNGTGSTSFGIAISTTNTEHVVIRNNTITDNDGASGGGISVDSSCGLALLGENHYYNNTTNESYSGNTPYIDLTAGNVSDSTTPFEDASNMDYRLKDSSNGYQSRRPHMGGTDINPRNFGPINFASGGGGGGTTSYVSVGG